MLTRRAAMQHAAALTLSGAALSHASEQVKQETKDPYADAKFVAGPPPKIKTGSFCIAVLPDTQHYSEKHPGNYLAQTEWIVKHQQARNIACVLHLGDITNRNTAAEWVNARKAMAVLDGRVPYFMCPGNHDYSVGGSSQDRTTGFNDQFHVADYRKLPTFGGSYEPERDRMENSWHTFQAGGRDFLVLCLEFGPRKDVVRWANAIAARHPKHEAILVTHAYMYYDDTRYDWKKYGTEQKWNPHGYTVAKNTKQDVTDGEELWQKLVSRHPNFILTLNGHVLGDGLGRTVTATPAGRDVHQLLVNFQMKPKGGDGWLRLLEFRNDRRTVDVVDYSPTRDQCNVSPQNAFAMTIAPPAGA